MLEVAEALTVVSHQSPTFHGGGGPLAWFPTLPFCTRIFWETFLARVFLVMNPHAVRARPTHLPTGP